MKMTKAEIITEVFALIAVAVAVVVVIICGKGRTEYAADPTTQATIEETTEEVTEPTEEETVITEETEPVKQIQYFDVPLAINIQEHIFNEAEEHGIDPAIIVAMAWRESTYRVDAIGDGGYSHGLLQVQPRFHQERMAKLGCDNMLDPFQNVTVAVDFLAYLIDRYDGNVEMALVAYNMGMGGANKNCFSKGVYSSSYSRSVLVKASELVMVQ